MLLWLLSQTICQSFVTTSCLQETNLRAIEVPFDVCLAEQLVSAGYVAGYHRTLNEISCLLLGFDVWLIEAKGFEFAVYISYGYICLC